MLTLYRAPWSTNVERVALALAHKGLAAESVVIDYSDRAEVLQVSGQPLVPVLVDGDSVVSDSLRILEHLDRRHPDPALYPAEPAERAQMEFFLQWFDGVWKLAPNQIEAEEASREPDHARVRELGALMAQRLKLFFSLLSDGREYLFGDRLSAADCAAFPFLKYARGRPEGDDEAFHVVLARFQSAVDGPLAEWIERVDALPRA